MPEQVNFRSFVLRGATRLPPDEGPSPSQVYDPLRQIWISSESGKPLVLELAVHASQFGETSLTETREGVDQSELAHVRASNFGETTVTKTWEGQDQTEGAFASTFGETTKTATGEGADQPERPATDAEYP